MIKLHQYPSVWGLPSLSPFCIKVEAFLRLAGIPYEVEVERNPLHGPKGKMPFVTIGGERLADSSFIIDRLSTVAPAELTRSDAVAHAVQRMMEENLYFVLLYSRWIDPRGWAVTRKAFATFFPKFIRRPVLNLLRANLHRQARAQGLARHSPSEVYEIGRKDLAALAALLGRKRYFLGDRPHKVDATVFAFLLTILRQPIETELKTDLLSFANLVSYTERLESMLFTDRRAQLQFLPGAAHGTR